MKISHLILGALVAATPFALKNLQGSQKEVCVTSNCAIPIPQEVMDQREQAWKESQKKPKAKQLKDHPVPVEKL